MRPSDLLNFGWRRRVPLLYQTEAAECGIACLAMIASFHGHNVDVATLRRQFAVSMHGTTLAALIDFAHRLELETRAVRLDVPDLRGLRLPCVLHWSFTHFVVLTRVGRRGVTIHDPSRGERSVGLVEVAQAFTGIALELWPTPRFEPQRRAAGLVQLVAPFGLARSLALVVALTGSRRSRLPAAAVAVGRRSRS
jgi:ATP-binding cassette subfamily B protein RaxB